MANKLSRRGGFHEIHHQGLNCLQELHLEFKHRICFKHNRTQKNLVVQLSKNLESDHHCQFRDQPHQATRSHSHACVDEVIDSREPSLEPKHKIFLSHSGAQKNFTEQLCKDLERVCHFPFFDKRLESLPKDENFPPFIIKAAQQCHVAILVLSVEFFTRSKWPMIELNEFVQAQASTNTRLKILPLFFGITLNQLKDAKIQKRWREIWQGWAIEGDRIHVEKWIYALSKVLGPSNGMEYDDKMGEVTYRENVVKAVCKLDPPDVKFDVSHVQSLERLCEPISQKLDETVDLRSGAGVVGLFGMGGVGKTTISKAMCNVNFKDFYGKVCHVELGGTNLLELRKKVLQELTEASREHLPNDGDKLVDLLKSRMRHHKVFLCLDNVLWEHDVEEAKMYLEVGYQYGSKVLVTSRSFGILKSLKLSKSNCMEMLELEEVAATKLFLHCTACTHENFNKNEWNVIQRCVEACRFSKRDIGGPQYGLRARQYLPLALKVWGIQLGHISDDPLRWEESLKNLSNHKFNHFKERDHPLFTLLRQGYDALDTKEQHVFLDLALFVPQYRGFSGTKYDVNWLSIIHRCNEGTIEASLNALRRKALLEDSSDADGLDQFKIHDLYLEFAQEEAQAGPFVNRRILHNWYGNDIPAALLKRPACGVWPCLERLGIYGSLVMSLKKANLCFCSNVELLQLYDCQELVEVDLQGIDSLISLDVVGCVGLEDKFLGVEKLRDLVWFRWIGIRQPAPFLQDLSSLTALQVLHLEPDHGKPLFSSLYFPPNLTGCINLRELTLWKHINLICFPDLSNLSKLRKINFEYCIKAKGVSGLSSLTNLKILNLNGCDSVVKLPRLGDLAALETLNVTWAKLYELQDLRKLRHLQDLSVSSCQNLMSLAGLEYLTSLRRLDASFCGNLRELPDCSNLKELEMVNLSWSGVCVLPGDFGRLAYRRTLKMKRCVRLFEPLVVWLLEQQRQMFEGSHDQISIGFSSGEQTMDQQLWSNIRKDVAYYMDEVISPLDYEFPEKEFLLSAHILSELQGGIDSVIKTLCDHDDMVILSLVVAKYAATGKFWAKLAAESTIQRLSRRIVQFLDQQMVAVESRVQGQNRHLLARIQFILKHVTNNQLMATTLGGEKISTFVQRCFNEAQTCESINIVDMRSGYAFNYLALHG